LSDALLDPSWQQTEAERAQRERTRNAEVQLLGGDDLPFQEYCRRREDFGKLVVEPDRPLDEMTLADYKNARALHERPKERSLEPGEMSLGQYRRWRGV
jgi:hypothetical protein